MTASALYLAAGMVLLGAQLATFHHALRMLAGAMRFAARRPWPDMESRTIHLLGSLLLWILAHHAVADLGERLPSMP